MSGFRPGRVHTRHRDGAVRTLRNMGVKFPHALTALAWLYGEVRLPYWQHEQDDAYWAWGRAGLTVECRYRGKGGWTIHWYGYYG